MRGRSVKLSINHMREIRQSGSEVGGNEQTVSPYPYRLTLLLVFLDSLLSQGMMEMGG